MKNLLMTGGTGFLGRFFLKSILETFPHVEKIYLVTRTPKKYQSHKDFQYPQIIWIEADLSDEKTQGHWAHNKQYKDAFQNIDTVIFAAALYDVKADFETNYRNTILTLENFLHSIELFPKLKNFHYISTIVVQGLNSSLLPEGPIISKPIFQENYGHAKFLAEKIFENFQSPIPFKKIIYRPGMVVGDSHFGEMDKIDGCYYVLKGLWRISFLLKFTKYFPWNFQIPFPIAFKDQTHLPLIPVDHCTERMCQIMKCLLEDEHYFGTYNVNNGISYFTLVSDEFPSIRYFLQCYTKYHGYKLNFFPVMMNFFHQWLFRLLGIPPEIYPYMFLETVYPQKYTEKLRSKIRPSQFDHYKEKIFQFPFSNSKDS